MLRYPFRQGTVPLHEAGFRTKHTLLVFVPFKACKASDLDDAAIHDTACEFNDIVHILSYLKERNIEVNLKPESAPLPQPRQQCPGSQVVAFPSAPRPEEDDDRRPSRLTHWPIQLHLISPSAPHYQGSDLLLAADCVAFSMADFHRDYLKDRTLAIACPKLDSNQEIYLEKLIALIDTAGIRIES